MSPVVAKASDVAGAVGCDQPTVATGCTGVVHAGDRADTSAEAG